jgi:putative protease
MAEEKKLIGRVTHYFGKIGVAGIELSDEIKAGNTVSIEGATTNFVQTIDSMQIDNKVVTEAKAGDHIGVKIKDKSRVGDSVYLVE